MKSRFACLVCLSVMVSWWNADSAHAVVVGVSDSNVDAYFGSQSDAYQDSNPTGLTPWPAVGPGPYFGTALTNVPSPPGGSTPPSNVTQFGVTPSISTFNDGLGNIANSLIYGYSGSTSGVIDDAQILLSMQLVQSATASSPSYAYEQLNYSADFALANVVNTAGVLVGAQDGIVTRSFGISGSVGSFVDFGGVMNFWDVPTAGSPAFLGQLTFSYNNVSPGAFSTVVTSSGFIGTPGNSVNSPDSIRVEGDFFIAGDPSSITIESVPEPSSLVLGVLAAVGLAVAAARRRYAGQ